MRWIAAALCARSSPKPCSGDRLWRRVRITSDEIWGSALPRVQRIAQSVADQIERQHHQKNRKSRPNRHPWRVGEEALCGIEHAAPGGRRRLLTEPQKDSAASAMMAAAMDNVTCTNSAGMMLGRI